ncbi:MAG: 2,6-beta-D-fructofuranosidase [Prevotella sp.]|jgi:hypothetical protein|nr:2,6-beta-D-fructofuranosidase [Prevotella sp.]MCI1281883.1 2,6-beta-D-fructofuranosidase [Prevotella sp.]
MKNLKLLSLLLMFAMAIPTTSLAQKNKKVVTDSLSQSKEEKNRNPLLNASADNQPRQVSIGLPSSLSATIYEDGLPVSYGMWPCLPYMYWAASAGHSRIGMSSLGENTITTGTLNYSIISNTRIGSDKFEGHANYTTNIFNLQRFDIAVAGPIKDGWSYSANAYVNHDPGTNKLADTQLASNMEIFKFGLTKRFGNGRGIASLLYKYSMYKGLGDAYGPFTYVGDGSVKEIDGFSLGKDGFMPGNDYITYRDVTTGNLKTIQRTSGTSQLGNDVIFNLNYKLKDNLSLDIRSKYRYANTFMDMLALAGVGTATASSGMTYAYDNGSHKAGDVFTGSYNSRYLLRDIGWERNWMNTAELAGHNGNHNWRIGFNFWWERQALSASTGIFAHTVEADPVWLNIGGNQGVAYNTGGEYYNTHETKTALYATDDWQASQRLWISAGIRAEYYAVGGTNALAYMNATDATATNTDNIRTANWSVAHGTLTTFDKKWLNPAANLQARYTIAPGFGVLAQYTYAMTHPNSQDFAGAYMPILESVNTNLGNAGIFWNTPWMKLVSQFSVIKQTNYKSRTQFTNPKNASDVVTIPITYDVQTMGWTTDVVLTPFKGFMFHGLLTLQNPLFKNFKMTANFSDGTSESYDFSDNVTTGVSKVLIELDPSYSFNKFRVWASARYQSKQYINKTNTLYFNGRWETFAGIDYALNKTVGLSVNFVNLLNEKGASGSIGAADLLTDVSAYKNYLMAGSYIRPFTVEFAAHINF